IRYIDTEALLKLFLPAAAAQGSPMEMDLGSMASGVGPSLTVIKASRDYKEWEAVSAIDRDTLSPLLASIWGEPKQLTLAAALPADADMASAAALPLGEYIKTMLTLIDPASKAQVDLALAQMEEATGLSLEKDILSWMGDEVAVVMAEASAGSIIPIPSWGICMTASDPEGAAALFARLEDMVRAKIAEEFLATTQANAMQGAPLPQQMPEIFKDKRHGDITSRVLAIPNAPIAVEYALVGDVVALGWGPAIDDMLLALSGQAPRLSSTQAWSDLAARVPGQAVNALSYMDFGALCRLGAIAISFMPEAPDAGVGRELLKELPELLMILSASTDWIVEASYTEDDLTHAVGLAKLNLF
ncbi:MAG TPA: DUF3352 domain-containing protein, partial [Alphaproteobacteria bacterium]|nr:DUF3352 domain-containing protein [Alphaproteobacteria bacterium]